jgi:protein CpxP
MNKVKLLSYISVGLLIINISILCLMFLGKPKHPGPPKVRDEVIEKLELNDNQILIYDQLIQWHQKEIMKAEAEMMRLKKQLYIGLAKGSDKCVKEDLIGKIAQVDIEIENIHYQHFQDIRDLCSEEQKIKFEKLVLQIAEHFRPMMKKKK